MKTQKWTFPVLVLLFLTAQPAFAQSSVEHSARGATHGSMAAGHSTVGAAKLAISVAAVPVSAAGVASLVAITSTQNQWKDSKGPLPISDETVTAGPPPALPAPADNKKSPESKKEE